jgi:septal ring factor EnvC (AmiA/AmiB activator)
MWLVLQNVLIADLQSPKHGVKPRHLQHGVSHALNEMNEAKFVDITVLKNWLGAVALIVSLSGVVYAWLTSRSKDNTSRLNSVETDLVDHGTRIQSIENELKHMPSKDDVNELKLQMSEMDGSIGRMSENLRSVNKTVNRVEEYLLKDKS